MSYIVTLQQLESCLWKAADILRGNNIDAFEYKDYLFGFSQFTVENPLLTNS